jgi:GT2 family glycosyltransferase
MKLTEMFYLSKMMRRYGNSATLTDFLSNMDITASIVLYKNSPEMVSKTIKSFLQTKFIKKLFLIDNSPTDKLRHLNSAGDSQIQYIKNTKNIGFGKAHNIGFVLSQEAGAKYHIVLNPDVYFEGEAIEKLYEYSEQNRDVGLVSPKILYEDGSLQPLCKLLPTPLHLFARRFLGSTKFAEKLTKLYELHDSGYNRIMNIPYLSGCFMFFRNETIKKVGMFDERIFMYIEDADITRRIHKNHKTIFYPHASIYHGYQKGSYKNHKLMLYNIHGALVYFNKWGWFWDSERVRINQQVRKEYL